MFKSESLHWLGAFKSEMMKSCDGHTDTRTQPFIVKDDKSYQQEFKMNYCNNLQDKNKVLILAHFIVQKRKNINLYKFISARFTIFYHDFEKRTKFRQ